MSAERRPQRGAVVGLGNMGSLHLRVLRAMDGVVVAVDPDADRRAAAQAHHPGLRTVATLAEALGDGPDFAVLATPAAALPAAALEAIAAGVAVLVEKPMAPDEVQALEVIRAAEAAGVALGVGHVERDDETTGLLEVNWLTPAKVREISVTGERGMFVCNYLTQELFHYEPPAGETTPWAQLAALRGPGEGNMTRFGLHRREPLLVEWEAFLGAVRTGQPPPVSGWDGLASLSTARAIQRAGREHAVAIPEYRGAHAA